MANCDAFVVDSKGVCFLCLSEVKMIDCDGQLSATTSLKNFLQYLKINVFELSHFSSSALSSSDCLEDNSVMVNLCRSCDTMSNNFTEMYNAWEKIRLEMDGCVQLMYRQMLIGERDQLKKKEYLRRMKGTNHPMDFIHASIVENLRNETMNKCFSRTDLAAHSQNSISPPTVCTAPSDVVSRSINFHTDGQDPFEVGNVHNIFSSTSISAQSVDNPQPSTSRGLATYLSLSEGLTNQERDNVEMDCDEEEESVKLENVARVLDILSEAGTGNEEQLFSIPVQEEEIREEELALSSPENEDDTVSSPVVEAIVMEDVKPEVADEAVDEDGDPNDVIILRRSARERRTVGNDQNWALPFACGICNKKFATAKSVGMHVSHHNRKKQTVVRRYPVSNEPYECLICKKICKSKSGFVRHHKTTHGKKLRNTRKFSKWS